MATFRFLPQVQIFPFCSRFVLPIEEREITSSQNPMKAEVRDYNLKFSETDNTPFHFLSPWLYTGIKLTTSGDHLCQPQCLDMSGGDLLKSHGEQKIITSPKSLSPCFTVCYVFATKGNVRTNMKGLGVQALWESHYVFFTWSLSFLIWTK